MGWHNVLHDSESRYWGFFRDCRPDPRAWKRARGASRPTTGDEAAAATAISEAAKTMGEMRTMGLEVEKRKFVSAIYTSPNVKPEASVKQIHTEKKLDHDLALPRAALRRAELQHWFPHFPEELANFSLITRARSGSLVCRWPTAASSQSSNSSHASRCSYVQHTTQTTP